MAVGFEFQAPTLKIYKIDKDTETELCKLQQAKDWSGLKAAAEAAVASPRFFDKSVVLSKSATGWYAVPDGDDVEFVTTEIPIESGGATRVAQVMTSIELVINRIKKIFDSNARRTVCPYAVRTDDPALFNQYPPFLMKWDMPNESNVIGFPQITGGIHLTKLRKVFKVLAKNTESSDIFLGKEKKPYVDLLTAVTQEFKAKKTVDPAWSSHTPSAEMRSLVSLIAAYLHRGGSYPKGGLGAVKQLWFIMARTDFAALYKQLPGPEQAHYRARPNEWVDYICKEVMPKVNKRYAGGMDPDGWLIDRLITDYKELKDDQRVTIEITRRQWLKGMVTGKDVLSQNAHPLQWWKRADLKMYKDVNGEHRLRGAGAMGDKMDELVIANLKGFTPTEAPGKHLPIFEFRAPGVGANVFPHTAWKDYAVKAYRFLAVVNVMQKDAPIDEQKVYNLA